MLISKLYTVTVTVTVTLMVTVTVTVIITVNEENVLGQVSLKFVPSIINLIDYVTHSSVKNVCMSP